MFSSNFASILQSLNQRTSVCFVVKKAETPVLVSNALDSAPKRGKLCQVADLVSARKCKGLPDYPLPVYRAAGAVVNGFPVICGGKKNVLNVIVKECYIHERTPDNKWRLLDKLKTERSDHASIELLGKLWVTGGSNKYGETLSSTEFVSTTGVVVRGPDLPQKTVKHCMAKLMDGKVMILGGRWYGRSVLIYDPEMGTFTDGPKMISERETAACTVFNSLMHGGRSVVMIVGHLKTTEILDYTIKNAIWEKSNYLHFTCILSYFTMYIISRQIAFGKLCLNKFEQAR